MNHSYSSPLLPKRLNSKVHPSLLCKNKDPLSEVRNVHSPRLERAKIQLRNHHSSSHGIENHLYEELNSDGSVGGLDSGKRWCNNSKISNSVLSYENTGSLFDYSCGSPFGSLKKNSDIGTSERSNDFSDLMKLITVPDSDIRDLSSLSPPPSPGPCVINSGLRKSSKYFSLIRRNRSQSPSLIPGNGVQSYHQEQYSSPCLIRKPFITGSDDGKTFRIGENSHSSINGYHHFDAINKESSWRKKHLQHQQHHQQFPRSKKQFPDPNALFPVASTLSSKQSSSVTAGSRLNFDLEALLRIDDLRTWIKDLEASRGMGYQTLYSDYNDYDTETTVNSSTCSSVFHTTSSFFGKF